jgi:hypothetical protein
MSLCVAAAGSPQAGTAQTAFEQSHMPPPASPAPTARTATIPALPEGWHPVRYAILRDGKLAILGANVDLRREWRYDSEGAVLGNPFGAAARAGARIWTFDGTRMATEASFPLHLPFPVFDRFPDGRWLVANARADQEPQGRILTAEGAEISRVRLGDGIQHLKIDDLVQIWVGWFDEGVFGNDGWSVPGHEWPPSSYGLAAFDDGGKLVAHAEGGPTNGIADCYALNVVGDTAWACTYTDFPILGCRSQTGSRWWSTDLSGSEALAVEQAHILAAGGYRENANNVALVRLDGDRGISVGEWRLPFSVDKRAEVQLIDGRGQDLHLINNGIWHRWAVADFLADVRSQQNG